MPPDKEEVTLKELVLALGDKIDDLTTSVDDRFRDLTREVADLRVRFAEAQVLKVRVDQQQAELARIETRFAQETHVALVHIRELEESLVASNIGHAAERAAMRREHLLAIQGLEAKHSIAMEKIRTHRERWDTVKGVIVPVVVSVIVTIVIAALSGAFP